MRKTQTTSYGAQRENVKEAFRILDPAPKEPLAKAILKALDSIDAARKALKERMK